MDKIEELIEKYWRKLKRKANVLSVRKGVKFVKGKNTGEPCITVYVIQKKANINPKDKIPEKIEGVKTDVVELSTTDFKIGETNVSKLPPKIQKKIAGGVKK